MAQKEWWLNLMIHSMHRAVVQSWVVSHCAHHHQAHAAKTNIQTRSATGDRSSSPFWDSMRSAQEHSWVWWLSGTKALGPWFAIQNTFKLLFFIEHHFYLKKELTDKLSFHRLENLAGIFSQMNEMSLFTSRKITNSIGCQWQNSGFQVKIQTLGKPVSATMSLTASQYLKIFLMKSVVILMVIIIIFVL